MEMANKFELHYYLSDGSHQIDAFLRNKCEAEVLSILAEISKILEIDSSLVATASATGGFRELWGIAKGNAIEINVLLLIAQVILTVVPMVHVSEIEELEKKALKLQIEETELSIEKLKEEIKSPSGTQESVEDAAKILSRNLKIIKRKSNFYTALRGSENIERVGFSALDSDSSRVGEEKVVFRVDFGKYVLSNSKLKGDEAEVEIEIVSPVLKEGNYKWKGILNGKAISFDMNDLAFKEMVLHDKIPFQHGSTILCILRMERELDELGDIVITGYAVTTVLEKRDGDLLAETPQGRKHRHAKKYIEGQGNLFK